MHLSKLILRNYRSFRQASFSFSPQTNLIIGQNGSGKTNLLEALNLLSSGKSFRSVSLGKLIFWNQSSAQVQAFVSQPNQDLELEVQLINKPESTSIFRKYLVNQVQKTRKAFLGQIKTVIFSPEDIRLTTGSPSRRRDFLNQVFSPINWRYAQALLCYHKALNHRNQLLDQIKQGRAKKIELFYWDQSLVKNDLIIHQSRKIFIDFINNFFSNHPFLDIKKLKLNYRPSILTQSILNSNYNFDLINGYTKAGCHRDDFSFDSLAFPGSNKDLANWGSRGQQRLAVLALRLAQINFIKQSGNLPILLLDDIFSELDSDHRHLIAKIIDGYQTIVTSADFQEDLSDFISFSTVITL